MLSKKGKGKGEKCSLAAIYFLLFTFAFSLFPSSLFAAGQVVSDIQVQGNTTVSTDTVLATVKTKKGDVFTRERAQEDIRKLWALGQFQDIQIEEDVHGGTVTVTYIVQEKPIITKFSFKGNKKLKKDDLEKEITMHAYRPLDEKLLGETVGKMKEAYAKKGYYLVDINYHVDKKENGDVELVFDIAEHSETVVRKIEFVGNHAFNDKELRKQVRTKEKSLVNLMSGGGKFKQEQIEQDVMLLTYFYLQKGYLKVKVDNPKVAISKDKRYIFITYTIEEGKPYKISDIDIEGDIITTKEEMKSLVETKAGTTYNEKTVEEDIMKMVDFYGELGYAFVNIRPATEPNDETLTTPLKFQIQKGNRIRIERINISGNTVTRDKVVRRELRIKEGDIYNTKLVNQSKDRLKQLGFFEEVNFATPRGQYDDTLVLNIDVKEKSTGTFNIGAGFSTVENFILSASVAKDNFFGYGIGGQISAELSGKRQQFMLEYRDPYFLDTQWMLNSSLYKTLYRFDDFDRNSYGGSLSVGHRIFEYSSISLGYQLENVEVSDFSYIVPDFFRQHSSGVTSEVILTLARDTRDNRLFPTKGTYLLCENEVAGTIFGGNNEFYRVTGNARYYQPVVWNIIAKVNAKIGYIKGLESQQIPLFERYYTGGVYSLRGFMPRSIGPKLRIPSSPAGPDADFVYGGDKLLLFNAELEIPIYLPAGVRWVFFADAGNAFAETQNYSVTNLRSDWGFGLRWQSPIGPLRFEWGLPFKRQAGEDPIVFNFTIGSLF